jgi:hypothetical protein
MSFNPLLSSGLDRIAIVAIPLILFWLSVYLSL